MFFPSECNVYGRDLGGTSQAGCFQDIGVREMRYIKTFGTSSLFQQTPKPLFFQTINSPHGKFV